jgi:hypothetical protein
MEVIFVIIFFGLCMALFAAFCAFTFKCFEFFFEARWTQFFEYIFFRVMVVVSLPIFIVFELVTLLISPDKKPRYRFSHKNNQPELLSNGFTFDNKMNIVVMLFWAIGIGYIIVLCFR